MNDDLVSSIYDQIDEMPSFKGLHVCAIDSSIIEIPNTKLTRDDFGIPEKTQTYKDTSVARISCMVDAHWDFIISSNLTSKNVDEITNALIHLDDAKNKLDLTKTITLYDRGYNSVELMFKTELLNSFYYKYVEKHQHLKRNNKKWKNIKKQIKHSSLV